MKIIVRDPNPIPGRYGPLTIFPTLENAEFTDDEGRRIEGITNCVIEMKFNEPIVAHVTHIVTAIQIDTLEERSSK